MKITIAAIGRLKAGPERELAAHYLDRAEAAGRKAGLSFAVREFGESRAGSAGVRKNDEAAALPGELVAHGQAGLAGADHGYVVTILSRHMLKVLGVVDVRRDRSALAFPLGGTLNARRRCAVEPQSSTL